MGCSQEQKTFNHVVDLEDQMGAISCYENDIKVNLEKYFQDKKGTSPNLLEVVACIYRLVYIISEHTRGSLNEGNSYTQENFRNFINDLFFKDNPMSEELFLSIMELKVIFVGGSTHVLTKKEILRLHNEVILFLEQQLSLLAPYRHIYFSDCEFIDCEKFSDSYLKEALERLSLVSQNFKNHFGGKLKALKFQKIEKFLINLGQNYDLSFQNLIKGIPVLAALKGLLVGGSTDVLEPKKWPVFFETLMNLWGNYKEYHHGPISDYERSIATVYNTRFHIFLEKAISLLEQSFKRHPNEVIDHAYFDDLIENLSDYLDDVETDGKQSYSFFSLNSDKKNSYKVTWKIFLEKLIQKEKKDIERGFDKETLNSLRDKYEDFHKFYIYALKNKGRICDIKDKKPSSVDILPCKSKLLFDEAYRFYISQSRRSYYDMKSLELLNVTQTVTRLIMKAYAKDQKTLNEEELMLFAQDFSLLLQITGIVQENSSLKGHIKKLQNITNIFLSPGDGLKKLSSSELNSLFHFLLGLNSLSQYFFKEAVQFCQNNGLQYNYRTCFKETFKDYGLKHLSSLPHMARYYESLGDYYIGEENLDRINFQKSFMWSPTAVNSHESWPDPFSKKVESSRECFLDNNSENLFKVCLKDKGIRRDSNNKEKVVSKTKEQFITYLADMLPSKSKKGLQNFQKRDIYNIFSTLFFIEVYYNIYDSNKNGLIEYEEALNSFHRFEGFIKEKSFLKSRWYTEAVFTFILAKGKNPKNHFWSFVGWMFNRYSWKNKISQDRIQLIKSFSQLYTN